MSTTAAYLLYSVFTIGAIGVYFLLPRAGRSKTVVGAVFALSAVAALMVLLVTRIMGPGSEGVYFCLFSIIALVAAVRVITHQKPVYSAVYFVLVVVAVAAMLVLQEAEFLAVALLIIYAGAIIVTYLFVMMLAQQSGATTYDRRAREPFLAVLAGFALMAAVAGRLGDLPQRPAQAMVSNGWWPHGGNTAAMGEALMTRYVVALEIAGLLLLIAMIGAIALSRKKVPADAGVEPPRKLGQVGKEVEPF